MACESTVNVGFTVTFILWCQKGVTNSVGVVDCAAAVNAMPESKVYTLKYFMCCVKSKLLSTNFQSRWHSRSSSTGTLLRSGSLRARQGATTHGLQDVPFWDF